MVDKISWDANKTKSLIVEYEKYELLYNPRHVDYRKKREREDALTRIANALNIVWFGSGLTLSCTVEDIKKKLNGLRSQYLFERAKINKSILQGDVDVYTPTIYWYPMLKFLEPVTSNGPSRSTSFADYVYCRMSNKKEECEDEKKTTPRIDDDASNYATASTSTSSYSSQQHNTFVSVEEEGKPELRRKRRLEYDPLFIPQTNTASSSTMGMSKLVKMHKRLTLPELREQLETFGKFVANELRGIYQSSDDVFLRQTKRQLQQVLIDAWTRIDMEDTAALLQSSPRRRSVTIPINVSSSSQSPEDRIAYSD